MYNLYTVDEENDRLQWLLLQKDVESCQIFHVKILHLLHVMKRDQAILKRDTRQFFFSLKSRLQIRKAIWAFKSSCLFVQLQNRFQF